MNDDFRGKSGKRLDVNMVSGKSISESKSGNHSRNRQTCDTHIINPMSDTQSKTNREGCWQGQEGLLILELAL